MSNVLTYEGRTDDYYESKEFKSIGRMMVTFELSNGERFSIYESKSMVDGSPVLLVAAANNFGDVMVIVPAAANTVTVKSARPQQ